MFEEKNPSALPSKLARSRSFRPKQVRPLKENQSEPVKSDADAECPGIPADLKWLNDPMNAAGYRIVNYNKSTLLLQGTDAKTLDEAKEVLSSHFDKKMLDQML